MPEESSIAIRPLECRLVLVLDNAEFTSAGEWHWSFPSDRLLCSNAFISLPPDAAYTRCILHPDDVPGLRARIAGDGTGDLSFRVLTNSGAVHEVRGSGISFTPGDVFAQLLEAQREQAYAERADQRRLEACARRAAAADQAERHTATGTWWYCPDTGELHYSDHCFRLHGLQPGSLNAHPQTFASFIHPDDAPIVADALLDALRRELPLEIEYRIYTAGGHLRHLRLQVSWGFSEQGANIAYGTYTDRTEFAETLTGTEKAASVAQQRATLLRLLESGGRADEDLSLFSFLAAHDLREPLRKLSLFSSRLLENEPALSEEGRGQLGRIKRATQRMDRLLQGLEELARLVEHEENVAAVSLDAVMDQALETLAGEIAASGACINRAPLPVVMGNEVLLSELFQHLLRNALQYRQPGRELSICIGAEELPDGGHAVSIRDNGRGFANELSGRIFRVFQRLSADGDGERTGIGLALCRRIMDYHQGSISAQGSAGAGAEFRCVFPNYPR
ncbi:MAG: PAS domain-containing sensor histidine kinase [Chitinophagaceae bacterium]|nr:MAG: PAS domain-containing sensor histidine kinase [Chitinophagaceae bacterium]